MLQPHIALKNLLLYVFNINHNSRLEQSCSQPINRQNVQISTS